MTKTMETQIDAGCGISRRDLWRLALVWCYSSATFGWPSAAWAYVGPEYEPKGESQHETSADKPEKASDGKTSESHQSSSTIIERYKDYHVWGDETDDHRDEALGSEGSAASEEHNKNGRIALGNQGFWGSPAEMGKEKSEEWVENNEKIETGIKIVEAAKDLYKAARSGDDKEIDKAQEKIIKIAFEDAVTVGVTVAMEAATEGQADKRAVSALAKVTNKLLEPVVKAANATASEIRIGTESLLTDVRSGNFKAIGNRLERAELRLALHMIESSPTFNNRRTGKDSD
jgi:hypothetical protein